jgi:hypothetical protein
MLLLQPQQQKWVVMNAEWLNGGHISEISQTLDGTIICQKMDDLKELNLLKK